MTTLDSQAATTGPDWLESRRAEAEARARAAAFPSSEEEIWRYSRVGEIDLERYPAAGPPPLGYELPPAMVSDPRVIEGAAIVADVVDGRLMRVNVNEERALLASVRPIGEVPGGEELFGSVLGDAPDLFAELNTAEGVEPVLVTIPQGARLGGPIVIRHWQRAGDVRSVPRTIIDAGAGSEATVIDLHGSDPVDALVLPVVEAEVGDGARLEHVLVEDLADSVWHIASQVFRVGRDAWFRSSVVAFGGHYARIRTDTEMAAPGAEGQTSAVYFADGDQELDFRTLQHHSAPNTRSELLFKGVLDGSARSIYTGMIRIDPDAAGVDAFQTNRIIKLSDEAWTDSVPNLEIENNDVKCSHASAIGPISADQLFYLEGRGIPTTVAERLVVDGFLAEGLEGIPHTPLTAVVRARLDSLFGAGADNR